MHGRLVRLGREAHRLPELLIGRPGLLLWGDMATTADHLADPELLATAWDLAPLVDGDPARGVDRQLEEARERATAFAETHAGRVAELDPDGLRDAMRELEAIYELIGKAASYASLQFATDTADPTRGALLQKMQELATEIETKLLFFELEWAALDDDRADELIAADGLDFCRHYLRSARRYRPHLLSEPEEKILTEKSISSHSAWSRLFGELVSALRVDLDGDEQPLDMALARLQDPDRDARRRAAEAVSVALEPGCARGRSSTTRSPTTSRSRTGCAAIPTGSPPATCPTRPPTSR